MVEVARREGQYTVPNLFVPILSVKSFNILGKTLYLDHTKVQLLVKDL